MAKFRKHLNKYFLKSKTVRKIKEELDETRTTIYRQGLIELERPIHHGYNAYFDFREDISRREDIDIYREALDMCAVSVWSRDKEFMVKKWRTKKKEYLKPSLTDLREEDYIKLSEKAREFFRKVRLYRTGWGRVQFYEAYRCTFTYELVIKIEKSFITHRREHNGILYQKKHELEKSLDIITDGHPYGKGYSVWDDIDKKQDVMKDKRQTIKDVRTETGVEFKKLKI